MICSLKDSTVHGISQARIPGRKWFAISYSRESSWSRDQSCISCICCIGRQIFYSVPPGKPKGLVQLAYKTFCYFFFYFLGGIYGHPAYLTYMQGTSCEMSGWMKHKLESRLPGKISITSDVQMTPPLWQKVKKTKEPLDESERGDWKSWLKTLIQKTKITVSSPITSWQIDGETMETVTHVILGGSKITADGDCSREIKRHLLLGRKAMTNLDSILKSRDVTLPTKVHLVKAMVFPVVMYGRESWTLKKVEHW